MLNNETYQLLLPDSFLQNASYLDTLTEDDLKFLNEAKDDEADLALHGGLLNVPPNRISEEPEDELEDEEDEGEEEEEEVVENDEGNGIKVRPNRYKIQRRCPTCQCGLRNARRIVGGKITTKYLYPWTVALRYGGRFYCGGSLITDAHVVTAGHCTEGLSARRMTASFLEHDLRQPEKGITMSRKIKSYKRHKRYNSRTLEHDIAILTLSRRVPIGSSLLRPICLPEPKTTFAGRKGYIAGWGTVGEFSMPSPKLRQAKVPIMSNRKCRQTGYGNEIKKSMICAGYPKRGGIDACQGDSGGSLMVPQNKQYYLAGVISWGDGCAMRNHPGVYTRVTNYVKWIRNRSENGCRCSS